jgi:hypothetical protein
MSTLERRSSPVSRQLEAYQESWQKDHDDLQECWTCEDTIAVGLSTYSLILRTDRGWRDRVFRGAAEYSEEANQLHRSFFEHWLRVTDEVLGWAAQIQQLYGSVEGMEELRQAESCARDYLSCWQPPHLSQAVGLREMILSPEAGAELDRVLDKAKNTPPEMPTRRMETRGPDFLLK